jgi:serine/threonine protein kinase
MTEKILGEFELFPDKLIGKGAWGEVYHGRQRSLNRPVAIKILKKDLTQDEEFVKRFRREAETLAKMSDDHIVHVYSAGEYEGSHYFIMEYVEGQPLSEFIERLHKFSVDEILYIAESVTRALKTAWESPAKIVHRDIKPSNIMVAYTGSRIKTPDEPISNILNTKIKVMDFGLAKVSEGGKDATMLGTVIGTPKYISPEQGLGNPVDIRSDIYSLGIVLYEMVTGRIPFEGETAISMIRHHIHDTATVPSRFNPDIPQDLEKIIMKCIQKEPEKRYTDPQQLLEDLTAFKQQRKLPFASDAALDATIISDIVRRRQRTRTALYLGIVGLVMIAGFVFYIMGGLKPAKTSSPIQNGVVNLPPPGPNTVVPITDTVKPGPNTIEPITDTTTVSTVPATTVNQEEEKLTVKVWTNKKAGEVYKKGEIIKFYFKANKDSYLYLYHMDAAGKVKMLFPNGFSKENRLKANQVYTIPDAAMNFNIEVTPPFGTEQVKVVASLQPMKDMDIKDGESGYRDLGKVTNINENKIITRSLDVVPKEERAEDTCTLTTTE